MAGIGSRLREVRLRLGLSQEKMGRLLNLKKSSFGKIERGECRPTARILRNLTDKYDVSMDYVFSGRGAIFFEDGNREPGEFASDEEEMLYLMKKVPLVRYSMLNHFQRFKIDNQDIIDKELAKK